METTLREYTRNFENRYGQIDDNHNWGMVFPVSDGITRATVDNRNEWVTRYHLEVPGWPDTYTKNGGTQVFSNGYHYLNSAGTDAQYSGTNPVPSGSHPAGDVTDEEIQYVSWWFRTHQYPSSLSLHWTDFFVQGISADNDRVMTAGATQGDRIDDLERYQKINGSWQQINGDDKVTYTIDYFSAEVMQPDPTIYPDGWDHIKNYNRANSNLLNDVPNLYVGKTEDNSKIYKLDGSYNNNIPSTDMSNRLIAFYESSGTENFRAHYSQNNADLDRNIEYNEDGTKKSDGHRSWVLVHLKFRGPSGRDYDGYYLGFDYQIFKEELGTLENHDLEKYTLHRADGYYSNWIFKLSPAQHHSHEGDSYTSLSRRIMCEDLGNTYDFDFNDIVFDATYNITKTEYDNFISGSGGLTSPIDVTITLQAAGGTMKIWAGLDHANPTFEAHHLLGNNSSSTPVNVGGVECSEVAIYHYKLMFDPSKTTQEERLQELSLNRIPIYVESETNKGNYLTNSSSFWATDDYTTTPGHHSPSTQGNDRAPRAFGVPVGVCWMNECKFIEEGYTNFAAWVQDMQTYGDGAVDPTKPWYISPIGDNSKIHKFTPYVAPSGNSSSAEIYDFDYSQFGQPLAKTTTHISDYYTLYTIDFNDFPQQPGKYQITALCWAKNTDPEVQTPKLKRMKWTGTDPLSYDIESGNGISGVVNTNDDYSTSKMYTVTFTVDVNSEYFDTYTHYEIENMYGQSSDRVGDLYVMRIGDSTQHGAGSYTLADSYGTDAHEDAIVDGNSNPHLYIPLSDFANQTDGKYVISIAVQTQNDPSQFNPNVQFVMTDKTNEVDWQNVVEKKCQTLDSGMNIALVQFVINFPITNNNNYQFIEIKNIFNGANPSPSLDKAIKDVKIKEYSN